MTKTLGLAGSITAMATPFAEGEVDSERLFSLCERQITRGTTAIVVCGSTGEALSLSLPEYVSIVRTAVAASRKRCPIIAGCSAATTSASAELAAAASSAGADALLCAAPAYVKPTQDGIVAHVRAVAHASALPIILYDVPGRIGVSVADETVARLVERGLIVAIKDATSDLGRPPRLRALCGEELVQLSGDDSTAAAHRAMGGAGCISVSANIAPALCASLHDAWGAGDLIRFGELRDLLAPLHQTLFLESNPIPLKAALAMLRLCGPELRLPLTHAVRATRERLADVLARIAHFEDKEARRRTSLDGPAIGPVALYAPLMLLRRAAREHI
jgi:4-hydroxy-tetrahydrodipicolinate synthase